jgi:hypothetical protein
MRTGLLTQDYGVLWSVSMERETLDADGSSAAYIIGFSLRVGLIQSA